MNEKLAMMSQFHLTRFYDVITHNSVFLTRFSNSGIPDPFKFELTCQTRIGFKIHIKMQL